MTTRGALREVIEQRPDEQAKVARTWIEDLRDASDEDGPPLEMKLSEALFREPWQAYKVLDEFCDDDFANWDLRPLSGPTLAPDERDEVSKAHTSSPHCSSLVKRPRNPVTWIWCCRSVSPNTNSCGRMAAS